MHLFPIHIEWKVSTFLTFVFLMSIPIANAQQEVIKNAIENLNEQSETDFDYSDLLDDYRFLMEHPININSLESEKLISLFLMDELQYKNLRQYTDSNGILLSPQELLLIDGFSPQDVQNLLPFIKSGAIKEVKQEKIYKIFKYGHHQVFLRYQRVLQEAQGYKNRTDSILNENPNSKYLGDANKYYLKYLFKYSNRVSAGLVAEKDAGEIFFDPIKNPVIDSMLGDKIKKGFDFYTVHLYVQKIGIIKQAAIGDYHLQFGQGLNLWSSLAFGKSSNSLNIRKFERGIKPNTSTDENKFLRGAAIQLAKNNWSVTAFYSSKKQDATDYISSDDQESHFLQSINGTGYHRTISELLKKNAVLVQLMGGRIGFSKNNMSLGVIGTYTLLNKDLMSSGVPYQYFNFNGKENSVVGADFQLQLKRMSFFGEFSYNIQGGMAYLAGVNAPLNHRLALSLLFRNYQKDYNNLFAAAFGENTQNKNEKGFYTGLSFQVSKKLHLNAYADIFSYPWLKYQVDAPSFGVEYLALLIYEYSRKIQMQIRARYKSKQINHLETFELNASLQEQIKYGFRYHISYQLHPLFILKNRIEYQIYETIEKGKQAGFLIYQDINYKSKNQNLGISARFALFDVQDYDSRIYAYENDLLYVFSVPAYFNRGLRTYLLFNYKISNHIQFWFKIAHTWYDNIDEISSGLNKIEGAHKTEVRAQLKIKI